MMKRKEIEKIIGEAIGEGSMCWSETPKGIFDSVNASRIVEETVNKIINIMKSKKDKQICRSRQGEKYRQMWEEFRDNRPRQIGTYWEKYINKLEQKYFPKEVKSDGD